MQTVGDAAAGPLVRFDFLAELLGGDRELMDEVVRVYRASAGELMDSIGGRLTAGELPAAQLAAHSLKGASASAGAERMRELAERLEHALKAGEQARALEALGALRSNFVSTMREFDSKFKEMEAG